LSTNAYLPIVAGAVLAVLAGCASAPAATPQGTTSFLPATHADADTAKARAANEFSCPSGDLEVEEISDHTFRIAGCGSQATYTCTENGRSGIDWSCMKEAK
jgi:hypothetical protein